MQMFSKNLQRQFAAFVAGMALAVLAACTGSDSLTSGLATPENTSVIDPGSSVGGFPGCIAGAAFDNYSITIQFEMPVGAKYLYINRDGQRVKTITIPTQTTWLDTNRGEGRTYRYTCSASFNGKEIQGFNTLIVSTKVFNAPEFAGVKSVVDVSNTLTRALQISWDPADSFQKVIPNHYKVYLNLEKGTDPATRGNEEPDWNATPYAVIPAVSGITSVTATGLGDELPYAVGVTACAIDPFSGDEICDQKHVHINKQIGDKGILSNVGLTAAVPGNGGIQLTMPWQESYGAVKERIVYYRLKDANFLDSHLPDVNTTLFGYTSYSIQVANYSANLTIPPQQHTLTGLADSSTYVILVRDKDPAGNISTNTNYKIVELDDITPPAFTGISTLRWLDSTAEDPKFPEHTAIVRWPAIKSQDPNLINSVSDVNGAHQYYIYVTSADAVENLVNACSLIGTTTAPAYKVPAINYRDGDTGSQLLTGLQSRKAYGVCVTAVDKNLNATVSNINPATITMRDVSAPSFLGINQADYSGGVLTVDWSASSSPDTRNYVVTIERAILVDGVFNDVSSQQFIINHPATNATFYKTPPPGMEAWGLTLTDFDRLTVSVEACDNAYPKFTLTGASTDNCTDTRAAGKVSPITTGDTSPPVSTGGTKISSSYLTPRSIHLWWNLQDSGSTGHPENIHSKLYYGYAEYPAAPQINQNNTMNPSSQSTPPDRASFEIANFAGSPNKDYNYLFKADLWDGSNNHSWLLSNVIRIDNLPPPPAKDLGWDRTTPTSAATISPVWTRQCDGPLAGPCNETDDAELKHYMTLYRYTAAADAGGDAICPVPKPTSGTDPNISIAKDQGNVSISDRLVSPETPVTLATVPDSYYKYRYEIKAIDHAGNTSVSCSPEMVADTVLTKVTKMYTDTASNTSGNPYPNGTEINIYVLFSRTVGIFSDTQTPPTITLQTGGTSAAPKTRDIPADMNSTQFNSYYFNNTDRILKFKYIVGPEDNISEIVVKGTSLNGVARSSSSGLAPLSTNPDRYLPLKITNQAGNENRIIAVDGVLPSIDYVTSRIEIIDSGSTPEAVPGVHSGSTLYEKRVVPIRVVFRKKIASVENASIAIDIDRDKQVQRTISCDSTVKTFNDPVEHSYINCFYDISDVGNGEFAEPLNYHAIDSFTGTVRDTPAGNAAVNPPLPAIDSASSLGSQNIKVDTSPAVITFYETADTATPRNKATWHWKSSKPNYQYETVITKGEGIVATPSDFTGAFSSSYTDACLAAGANCPSGYTAKYEVKPVTFDREATVTEGALSGNPRLDGVYNLNVRGRGGTTTTAIFSIPVYFDNIPPAAPLTPMLTDPQFNPGDKDKPTFEVRVDPFVKFASGANGTSADTVTLYSSADACANKSNPQSDEISTAAGTSAQSVSVTKPILATPGQDVAMPYVARITDSAGNYLCSPAYTYTYNSSAGAASRLQVYNGTAPAKVSAGAAVSGLIISALDSVGTPAIKFQGDPNGKVEMTVIETPPGGLYSGGGEAGDDGSEAPITSVSAFADTNSRVAIPSFHFHKAGDYKLSFNATGQVLPGFVPLTFIMTVGASTAVSAANSTVTASSSAINQAATATLTITLFDKYGNQIQEKTRAVTVAFDSSSTNLGTGLGSPLVAASTSVAGVYKATFTAANNPGFAKFKVHVGGPGGAGTPTLLDTQPVVNVNPAANFASASQTVFEGATAQAVINLEAASASPITVNYSSNTGTANAPGRFDSPSGSVTFNPGETTKTISVVTKDDTAAQNPQTIILAITDVTNGSIGSIQSTHTINLDDNETNAAYSSVVITPASIRAGTGSTSVVVTARNSSQNPIPGKWLNITGQSTGSGLAYTPAARLQTDSNGVATFTVTSSNATVGSAKLTLTTEDATPVTLDDKPTVYILSASPDHEYRASIPDGRPKGVRDVSTIGNWKNLNAAGVSGSDGSLAAMTPVAWHGNGQKQILSTTTGPFRMLYDGSNDFVNFDKITSASASYALVLRPSNPSALGKTILGNADATSGMTLRQAQALVDAGKLELVMPGFPICTSKSTLVADMWYLVHAVFDSAASPKAIRLYINGVQECTKSPTGTPAFAGSTKAMWAGADSLSASGFWNGYLTEIRLFSSALAATDVTNEVSVINGFYESAPANPSDPQVTPIGSSPNASAFLTWSDSSANETGFVIERSMDGGVTYPTEVARVGAALDVGSTTGYEITGLSSGTYRYRVRAYNMAGYSAGLAFTVTIP